jgi:Copper amine oxidase, enzyme domain
VTTECSAAALRIVGSLEEVPMAAFGDYHPESHAGWWVYWRIRQLDGSGLEVWFADFHGRRVLYRGSQPFALVPYHYDVANPPKSPPGPKHSFKDGINPQCGGVGFRALKHTAPNSIDPMSTSFFDATADTDAVVVHKEPATGFEPAHLAISAKFQCGWYQYVHRWIFDGDGNIHPQVAMGGALNPHARANAHVHHMYFRIDLDIDGHRSDLFEVFDHSNFDHPGGDAWEPLKYQKKLLAAPATARKWQVRDVISRIAVGRYRAFQVEVPQVAGVDTFSTGDLWVTVFRGDEVQQGQDVGADCTDNVLETVYAQGPLDTNKGSDIVFWVVVRAHHEPREEGEEVHHLPYHYQGFSITPRNFEEFRGPEID